MSRFEDPQWIEKQKKYRGMNGKDLVLHKESGFLEKPDGSGFSAKKKKRFLELKAEEKPDYEALRAVDVTRQGLYGQLAVDPEFRRQYVELDEAFTDDVEMMLKQNAKSNKMASAERIFYLKKKRPEIYADKLQIQQNSNTDDVVNQLMSKMVNYQMIPRDAILEVKGEIDESNKGEADAENDSSILQPE